MSEANQRIKVSAGTLQALGIRKSRVDATSTTAYLLSEGECQNRCSFCAQATSSQAKANVLGRISWPEQDIQSIAAKIETAYQQKRVRRTCLQVVRNPEAKQYIEEVVGAITQQSTIPICVSADINSLDEIQDLLDMGVEKVSIALDAVNPKIFQSVKGGSLEHRLKLLTTAAQYFPNRMSTHLIVGLGETEQEMVEMIDRLLQKHITIALFAFTPIKGTALQFQPAPVIGHYRRVQIALYLLMNHKTQYEHLQFDTAGKIIDFGLTKHQIVEVLLDTSGKAFETTGCDDCNRPYYNEKPGKTLYNYPYALNVEQVKQAILDAEIIDVSDLKS
ncbi:hypothetical protein BHU72_02235 [Desulfuribacillus stibiiarsenatis]|uniref:biotin synthase n=1 Tax=Desulfuribacillus stibiiarsenatis TaxID=1390249 RepID=A0A1E5L658_9FIRM|nr:radical SAM protein [Desulfuribacillus stibiiarsenatis]OEH85637.1 hypothetical protein BHU72_02235 [Desulfuribacillus stibiiarsenatis]